jgi:glycosyltransferase involved in cell wall biosynthesis
MWNWRRIGRRDLRRCRKWLDSLRQHPPEVLIGANLPMGGVRHHIQAIKQYSSLRLGLAPPDELVRDFSGDMRETFLDFVPSGIPVVHSHVLPWFINWCQKHHKPGVKWIHTYHLNYFPEHGRSGLLPWQKEINDALLNVACHADVRISVARWQQDDLLKTHHIDTVYLPNGVDVAICDKADANRFRKKVGNGPFVLFVGRNDPVKNPEDFVRLAQRLPRLRFVMIGHELSADLVRKEWKLDVPENLVVQGAASHAGIQDALAACSALVVTSKREGLPTLLLEAMAHQKPIVVPDEAGCMEAIGNGQFGFIYRQRDLDDLAGKMLQALADTEKSKGARERVLAEYDWRAIAPKLDAIYRKGALS